MIIHSFRYCGIEFNFRHINLILISGFIVLFFSCNEKREVKQNSNSTNVLDISNVPPQPGQDSWKFINDLQSPMWTKHPWEKMNPKAGQADLTKGVTIKANFSDPKNRLETAYNDLRQFLTAGDISTENGEYIIETVSSTSLEGEAYRLEIEPKVCRIVAGDAEGIRRGIFHLEDQMLRLRAGLLPLQEADLTNSEFLNELGREFAWEGHRRQDQIRFGVWGNSGWNKPPSGPNAKLFPIPQSVLSTNSNLVQNPL